MPPITSSHWVRNVAARRILIRPSARHSPRQYSSEADNTIKSTQDSVDKRSAQQNRHNIDRQSDEVSLSGTDDAVAAQTLSFDHETTDPEENRTESGKRNSYNNPLEASPANRSMSEGTADAKGGVDTKQVTKEKATYSNDARTKSADAGSGKKVFAGSTKEAKERKLPPMINSGSR
ncbi:hypothetical protein LTR99_008545 [Exophiala xenobiotica]|uniref:Uncharacterized protein n=1 Tax=Vermiconidia calcicola TaxID=1690605 RepID=A0AAV9PZZ4_9PEZI|nr:hypothetical protein LTR92_008307 [Exophiala xenobiotica]KAK5532935.1 hypothetical protein LTR25_007639 [Vermiconidia calcicola]KAK5546665.1 hypothetical protein LTR23_003412 [Chaetothyriales sp. CCFEE 6169]KAK5269991.1 hypothetical protein LTR96_004491 [Exophiala xenobiotica]KAK5296904.1 hypothetical protein LTR99_008545 [Exophiala xenobiotica]